MYVYKCLWQNVRRDKISGLVQTFSNVTQVSGKIIYHYFKDGSLPSNYTTLPTVEKNL